MRKIRFGVLLKFNQKKSEKKIKTNFKMKKFKST